MGRKKPTQKTIRLLYAHSGNQCAFPDCTQPIFNDDNLYVADLCHIEAANEKGARFNSNQTDDERCSAENLLFLCGRHHKEIDHSNKYDVFALQDIKKTHEAKFLEKNIVATKQMLQQIDADIKDYWDRLKSKEYDFQEYKIVKDLELKELELFKEIKSIIQNIQKYCDTIAQSDSGLHEEFLMFCQENEVNTDIFASIPYYKNPLINRNWELHSIGNTNLFTDLYLSIKQLKLRFLEILLKNSPNDNSLKQLILKARTEFENDYDNSYYVD